MPYIRECIVTTVDRAGKVHIAPLGIIAESDGWIIAPFRPSATLVNLAEVPVAVASYTDDVRIFAGCLTGRKDWPTISVEGCPAPRLEAALAHSVLEVVSINDDGVRPRHFCRVTGEATHAPFTGLNRAKAAVLELAILVSRLGMLRREKIEMEIDYLTIAIEKTAGPEELEAWGWLMERVTQHFAGKDANGENAESRQKLAARLQELDDRLALCSISNTAIRLHAVATHHLIRIGNELVEVSLIPGDARLLHRR